MCWKVIKRSFGSSSKRECTKQKLENVSRYEHPNLDGPFSQSATSNELEAEAAEHERRERTITEASNTQDSTIHKLPRTSESIASPPLQDTDVNTQQAITLRSATNNTAILPLQDRYSKLNSAREEYRRALLLCLKNPRTSRKQIEPDEDLLGSPDSFITRSYLEDVLTLEKVQDFLEHTSWFAKHEPQYMLAELHKNFIIIIGILILCWCRPEIWDEMPMRFACNESHSFNMESGNDGHSCDRAIPLSRDRLRSIFHDDLTLADLFFRYQYIFHVHGFVEDIANHYDKVNPKKRLPFLLKLQLNEVQHREVFQVTLAPGQLPRNTMASTYALKTFKDIQSFDEECAAHGELRRTASSVDLSHIVVNLFSFQYGPSWFTMYPWADIDLSRILHGELETNEYYETDRFSPNNVFEQLAGLTDALASLHSPAVSIKHFDIKPENILIYNLYSNPQGCGVWKLADFGLARVKYKESLPLPRDPNTAREITSVTAPRQMGVYQPPEMRPRGRVSALTDVYSFGAVLAVIWPFLLNGPHGVARFHQIRIQGYSDGNFYFTNSDNQFEVKPEIEQWQNGEISNYFATKQWPQALLSLIRNLMKIEREDRIPSKVARITMGEIANGAANDAQQSWSYDGRSNVSGQLASLPRERLIGSSAGLEHHTTYFPPTELASDRFLRFYPPKGVLQGTMSSSWVAFMSEAEIGIYTLNSDSANAPNAHPMACSSNDVRYDKVRLVENWMAILVVKRTPRAVNYTGNTPTWVELHSLKYDEVDGVVVEPQFVEDVSPNTGFVIDIVLSPTGRVAVVGQHAIHVLLDQIAVIDAIERQKFLAASFSLDGKILCVCCTDDEHVFWKLWEVEPGLDVTSEPLKEADKWWYSRIPASCSGSDSSLSPGYEKIVLQPTLHSLSFFAISPSGGSWSIAYTKSDNGSLPWPKKEECVRAVHFAVSHKPHAIITANVSDRLRLSGLGRLESYNDHEPATIRVVHDWLIPDLRYGGQILDIRFVAVGGRKFLRILLSSGTITSFEMVLSAIPQADPP